MRAAAMIGCDLEPRSPCPSPTVSGLEITRPTVRRRARTAYPADVNGGVADATAGRYLIFFFAGTAGIM